MAGDVQRRIEWRGGEARELGRALVPVVVVVGGIDAGDAFVARLRAAAGREVGFDLVCRDIIGLCSGELPAGREIVTPRAGDRRPPLGRAPLLGVDGEVMDRVLV